MDKQDLLSQLSYGLIVSCQAEGDEPLNTPEILTALAQAAIRGGAIAIRAERPENIARMKQHLAVPIIGLYKRKYPDSEVYITPTLEDARAVSDAGADIIAMDATDRPRPNGQSLAAIVSFLRRQTDRLLMADVSTLAEGLAAAKLGFDLIGTTLSGYTANTLDRAATDQPDFDLLSNLVERIGDRIPIIAEGRIWTAEQATEALRRGAFAVVVGTAITRPTVITRRIAEKIDRFKRFKAGCAIGIDLGGTKASFGIVNPEGTVQSQKIIPSRWERGTRQVIGQLIDQIQQLLRSSQEQILAIGIAASGRVDPLRGIVFDGVPLADDYIGFPIVETFQTKIKLPISIENDANAAAFAEYALIKASRPDRLVVITIGTGIGGGIIIDGKLVRGRGNAGEIGHICIEPFGRKCRCGRRGCLEAYASRSILQQEIQQLIDAGLCASPLGYSALNTQAIIELIRANQDAVANLFHRQLDYLAAGLETIFHTIDPDLLVLSGEFAQLGEPLIQGLQQRLHRPMKIMCSQLGNQAGFIGAALLALNKLVIGE
ncbi:MAG: putative N-acetylmannosamine-6-phosphate 2-epimerase [candidate division KSB1 bacterium]|nr:putative N-acetylmannosamine-6-phosphate 2-epimerase [candidate division KSB1 bacterium]MDZ7402262.1 putative N-acetylmannosamine-6-phosphate 2-epimerase [candidate division KSB1 bacterium]